MKINFLKFDWPLFAAVTILCIIGLLQIYSLSLASRDFLFFKKQLIFIIIGIALMFFFSLLDYRFFQNSLLLFFLYLLTLILLFSVIFLGKMVRGSSAWFNFGIFSFQPVELAKLVVILVLAKYFSYRHVEIYRVQHIIVSGLYIFLPVMLVLTQPDLGSSLVLIAIWLGIVISVGIKFRHLFIVFLIGLIIVSSGWLLFLKEYQKQRILTFLNPQEDPLGASYSLNQAIIAIGAGGLFGRGLGHGTQSQLNFLPESKSDFIFAAFAEEWGFAGVAVLFGFWLFLFWRLMRACGEAPNNFSKIFIIGVSLMLFSHTVINIGMNMGLLPITGLPLPFLSYGGSNLIINFITIGIVGSIIRSS